MSHNNKKRYIPFRKTDIITMILNQGLLKSQNDMKRFCQMVEIIFHYNFYTLLEKMKNHYFPINPDFERSETVSTEESEKSKNDLISVMKQVLNDANYDIILKEDLEKAYIESGFSGIKLNIDMNAYDFLEIYTRGSRKEKYIKSSFFGMKKIELTYEVLERVILIATFKSSLYGKKHINELIKPGSTIIKLFRDVPLKDLEMLLPNSKVVMSLKDKLFIGVPAIIAGIPLIITKVVSAFIITFLIISTYFGFKGKIQDDQMRHGFVALKIHNKYTADVYALGVLEHYHRQGIGHLIIESCVDYCQRNSFV